MTLTRQILKAAMRRPRYVVAYEGQTQCVYGADEHDGTHTYANPVSWRVAVKQACTLRDHGTISGVVVYALVPVKRLRRRERL